MIEYQYDEKTFRKMAVRISIVAYLILSVILVAILSLGIAFVVDNYLSGERDLKSTLISAGMIAIVLVVMIVVFVVSMRKQLSKSFAMYSVDGFVRERVELTDEEIIVTNVPRQSVSKLKRSDVIAVKKYKDFFCVITREKRKWVIPFNEQTTLLFDALTGKSSAVALSSETKVESTDVEQPVQTISTDALSFEYEITEQNAISMLTKVITLRFRIVLAAAILCSVVALGFFSVVIVNYWIGSDSENAYIYIAFVLLLFAIFFWIMYGSRGKSGKTSGLNYFNSGEKDGVFLQRVELYEQGIVVVNVLRDTRVRFRFSDMDSVRLCDSFFYVEFKTKELLPVPLTDNTRGLLDILKKGVPFKN